MLSSSRLLLQRASVQQTSQSSVAPVTAISLQQRAHGHDHHVHLDEGLDKDGNPTPWSIAEGRQKRGFLFGEFNPQKDVKMSEKQFWAWSVLFVAVCYWGFSSRPCAEGIPGEARKIIEYRRYMRDRNKGLETDD